MIHLNSRMPFSLETLLVAISMIFGKCKSLFASEHDSNKNYVIPKLGYFISINYMLPLYRDKNIWL